MGWRKAEFKGKQIWAAVAPDGTPVVESGRIAIRYSKSGGAKIYRAGASGVKHDAAAAVEALEEGAAPDETAPAPAKSNGRGSGFGSAGTRTEAQAAMAASAARKLVASLPAETVVAYTDGSCRGNPGPAGSGAVVLLPDGRRGEASRSLGHGTNNIAELTAIGLAIDLFEEAYVEKDTPIALFTDSSYSHGVLRRGWKAKANQQLIEELKRRLAPYEALEIHWIAGHVGIPENERADTLANLGVGGRTDLRWLEPA